MKSYCRNIDITSYEFLSSAYQQLQDTRTSKNRKKFYPFFNKPRHKTIMNLRQMIVDRKLNIRPIHYYQITDPINKKVRDIGEECPEQQFFDNVCEIALRPLLKAKVGYHQCSSVLGKGQRHAKKYIERWVKEKKSVYYVKLDIRHYYPSVDIDVMMSMLRRDVDNEPLLWLIEQLLRMNKLGGMSIGSLLSQRLSNYYLSAAFRMVSNLKIGRGYRKSQCVRHVLTYADDWLLISDKKHKLRIAIEELDRYLSEKLHVHIKPWKICKVQDEPIDMVGYVFKPGHTKIRTGIFLRARKAYIRARRSRHRLGFEYAARCVSYWGYFKRTDTYTFKKNIFGLKNRCKRVISYNTDPNYRRKKRHANKQIRSKVQQG